MTTFNVTPLYTLVPRIGNANVPVASRRRFAAGRRVVVPASTDTVRDMIRKHLSDAGRDQVELAGPWKCKPQTVKHLLWKSSRRKVWASQHIDAVVEFLQLSPSDAALLYRQAAREAGYKIDCGDVP